MANLINTIRGLYKPLEEDVQLDEIKNVDIKMDRAAAKLVADLKKQGKKPAAIRKALEVNFPSMVKVLRKAFGASSGMDDAALDVVGKKTGINMSTVRAVLESVELEESHFKAGDTIIWKGMKGSVVSSEGEGDDEVYTVKCEDGKTYEVPVRELEGFSESNTKTDKEVEDLSKMDSDVLRVTGQGTSNAKGEKIVYTDRNASSIKKEEVELEEAIYASDYNAGAEKTAKGYRPHVTHKEKGHTMYSGGATYKEKEHAVGHAQAYVNAYAKGGPNHADSTVHNYKEKHKEHMAEEVEAFIGEAYKCKVNEISNDKKAQYISRASLDVSNKSDEAGSERNKGNYEKSRRINDKVAKRLKNIAKAAYSMKKEEVELEIDEALETRISGGKVPIGQHTLHYKTDKSHKYIENSIKARDPDAKITGKDGHTVVHATAQAHSGLIHSMRQFRTKGVVHDTNASNMKEEVEITESNASAELEKYGKTKGGIDKSDFLAIARMIKNKKSAKDVGMMLKALDTDPRDKILSIISKADKKMGAEVMKAAGMKNLRAQYEEVEQMTEEVEVNEGKRYGLTQGLLDAVKGVLAADSKAEPLDPVDPKEAKKDFKDRKDKDIDNDGDVDKTDKYLAKKRKAVTKAVEDDKAAEDTGKSDAKGAEDVKKGKGTKGQETIEVNPNVNEMSEKQMKKREEIVKSMKKDKAGFEKRYGDRAKEVMYATATKMAMKEGFELDEEALIEMDIAEISPATVFSYGQKRLGQAISGKLPSKKSAHTHMKNIAKAQDRLSGKKTEFSKKEEGTVTSVGEPINPKKDKVGFQGDQGSGNVGLGNPNQVTYSKPDLGPLPDKELKINPTVKRVYDLIKGKK